MILFLTDAIIMIWSECSCILFFQCLRVLLRWLKAGLGAKWSNGSQFCLLSGLIQIQSLDMCSSLRVSKKLRDRVLRQQLSEYKMLKTHFLAVTLLPHPMIMNYRLQVYFTTMVELNSHMKCQRKVCGQENEKVNDIISNIALSKIPNSHRVFVRCLINS